MGQRVLLVSTDPASNLDEVLGVRLTSTPTNIASVPRLAALNIDPAAAAAAIAKSWWGRIAANCPKPLCAAWRNNFPAPARWRLPPSTNFQDCSANRRDRRFRPRHFRHRADRPHAAAAVAARAWTGFLDTKHDRQFLSRPAGGVGEAAGDLRKRRGGAGGWRAHDAGAGEPGAKGRAGGSGTHQR
jgi:hypothetical protein